MHPSLHPLVLLPTLGQFLKEWPHTAWGSGSSGPGWSCSLAGSPRDTGVPRAAVLCRQKGTRSFSPALMGKQGELLPKSRGDLGFTRMEAPGHSYAFPVANWGNRDKPPAWGGDGNTSLASCGCPAPLSPPSQPQSCTGDPEAAPLTPVGAPGPWPVSHPSSAANLWVH